MAGNIGGLNVAIDDNEIMARNNGAGATLNLNVTYPSPGSENSTPGIVIGGNMVPVNDGEQFLGRSTLAWRGITSHLYTTVSDARYKKNIQPLHYGLEAILSLRPVSYQWKHVSDDKLNLGLLAQEVEPIVPEAVTKDENPEHRLALNYDAFIPILIKAVQEQQSLINEQRAENANLKARLDRLEKLATGPDRQ
jgi:hypothetical protein